MGGHPLEREQGHRRGSTLCYVNSQEVSSRGFRSVVFNHEPLCPSGDIWPGPGTFFIVMAGEVGCAIDIWWIEAKDAAKYPTTRRTPPPTKSYPAPNANSAEVAKPWFV